MWTTTTRFISGAGQHAAATASCAAGPSHYTVGRCLQAVQASRSCWAEIVLALLLTAWAFEPAQAADKPAQGNAEAKTEAEMKPYTEPLVGTDITFDMVPIPGGTFTIGSPAGEVGRKEDEGPQRKVQIAPFWMGKCEVTWDEYDIWSYNLDIKRREVAKIAPTEVDKRSDAVTRPTKPYTDMTFGMGHDGYPAICMTQLAAKTYCEWLTAKTGHYYRLPTEAEWEYACRAGTTTAYSFGDGPEKLDEYAWFADNSEEKYQKVGLKKPNPWGLYDMHGNVMEWTLDQYQPDAYSKLPADKVAVNPFFPSTKLYPHAARGGSWEDDAPLLRSASRQFSDPIWKIQDPQIPKSRWFLTDALFLGFRVVRPLAEPDAKEKLRLKGTGDDAPDR